MNSDEVATVSVKRKAGLSFFQLQYGPRLVDESCPLGPREQHSKPMVTVSEMGFGAS